MATTPTSQITMSTPPSEATDPNIIETRKLLARLMTLYSSTAKGPMPRKLPLTSPERLSSKDEKTILYLAYGSNLSHETFVGNRGIKPLSAINVHVPSLDLTFDLAGIPYIEPCFANTAYRDEGSTDNAHTNAPDSNGNTTESDANPPATTEAKSQDKEWKHGLIGVVYEVTPSDYRTIIRTEGGGSSYQDILVPCYPIPPSCCVTHVFPSPNQAPTAKFHAHTLLSPSKPGRTRKPGHAQPSPRYLHLLTSGAIEHSLPLPYIAYLYSLTPYTITSYRQRIGQVIFLAFWTPFLLLLLTVSRLCADGEGRIPKWLVRVSDGVFGAVWRSYDAGFRGVFGEGERTVEQGEGDEERGWCGRERRWWCEKGVRL